MAKIFEMNQLTPTMTEGTIAKWLKKVGDSIGPGEILAEVETDKAVMEMEAYEKAVILEIILQEGTKVKVGTPVAVIGKAGEDFASVSADAKAKLAAALSAGSAPAAATEAAPAAGTPPVRQQEKPAEVKVAPSEPAKTVTAKPETPKVKAERIIASPLAKSIALEKGVDIYKVDGTGPGGRITKTDVLNYISGMVPAASSSKKGVPSAESKRIEISGMRKTIAVRLHDAKNNIPHFYLNLEFDAEPLVNLRTTLNSDLKSLADKRKEEASSVSVNDFIVKACSVALQRVPEVNSSWRGDHILQHGRIDIGVAVSIDNGLITPYVRNADRLSLLEINAAVKELAGRARNRKLKPEEYMDGTFTISNLGMFGITHFSAIINEPEAALMAVGGLIEKPVVKKGAIVPGKTITVTLSCDHRVVDGAVGARFMSEFRDIMEHPSSLMAGW
ncbi:MAG TPA: pyruvate dehydrogenase complex dihydrolipoamide acetyltransferase [Leptospiraceae bacterium]|nr:pyruvate dehydrogenase complex dihydrolipoamide acetyltransferase [Leptospiraceae bacterium]HNF15626.1 pyruvate dehydrogenase complex dihydrolipoamide acetyltransferase [Leptospiraceae bacterium]HNN05821.1 pyruvate dehydrogenase complex dihydrolipoamide acetyltransferase [Leptospiraceae bacterium]